MDYHRYLQPYKRAWLRFLRIDLSKREQKKAEAEFYRLHQKVYAPLKTRKQEKQRDRELLELF